MEWYVLHHSTAQLVRRCFFNTAFLSFQSIDPEMSLPAFINKVSKKFSLQSDVSMRYRDEEGSMITILDDDDWESAVDTARSYAKGRAEGKIEVWVEDT